MQVAAPARATAPPPLGLTTDGVLERRARGLGNTLPPPTGRTYWQIIRENTFTFINNVLFGLGFALVLVGRPVDALISVTVIALNIVVSTTQEIRAKRILDRAALLVRATATVLRDGQTLQVPPDQLVVDDVIHLGPGDQVLLDGTLINGTVGVDESQLTGESDVVPKQPGDPVMSGSFCVSGAGWYRATKVGNASFANQLTAGARAFRRVLTPLQREINLVVRIMLLIVIYLETLFIVEAVLNELSLADSVKQATVIAGLIPNGLFLSIAVAYALGAVRILRFGALVQQSNSIESLSNVDVLCLDKTGTLTANQLQLEHVAGIAVDDATLRSMLGQLAASTAAPNKTSEAIGRALPAAPAPVVSEVPFSSERKWSAVAIADGPVRGVVALGAPEILRSHASGDWERVADLVSGWAAKGLRTLVVLHHPDPAALRPEPPGLPGGMAIAGVVALSDRLRPEAQEAVEAFVAAGVRPKIISGDSVHTVAALARQAGFPVHARLYSGPELEAMDEAQFAQAARDGDIFGRVTPHQKERLISVLRASGAYVAMIGDGVNDVLSLKRANLGVAMQSGSQATRAVADIILTNDSFAALVPAVHEGQRIINGMQAILRLFLTRIGAVALVLVSATLVGVFPFELRQVSGLTLLTVGIPSVALAIWARPGKEGREGLVRSLVHFVLPASTLMSLLALGVFYGTLILEDWLRPDLSVTDAEFLAIVLPEAQTALASFMVTCGLLLIVFVAPPTPWWSGGARVTGDWRPTILAAVLFVVFVACFYIAPLRQLYVLELLNPWVVGLVAGAAAVWMFGVRFTWRQRLVERFFALPD